MSALDDFNHIKDVLEALDVLKPARFGYTETVITAAPEAEVAALTGVYITEDSSQINSIPTPDLIAVDDLIINIGLRSQAATISRMGINHFFGRLGLNLLKLTEKIKLLVDNHLVNRYITPSGNVMEDVTTGYTADTITLVKHKSPLSASAPITSSSAISLLAAVYNGNAGVMTGADKKVLDDISGTVFNVEAKIYASEQQNLVYNYDFRYFSNQLATISSWYSYLHPDGWVYSDSGTDGKIGYESILECCKIQTSSDGSGVRSFKQALHEFVNWGNLLKGSSVTLKAFVKGSNVTVKLTDGITVQSFALQNTGGIEEVTLQIPVNISATELTVLIESSTSSNVIEIYKIYANKGEYAIESLPCIVQGKIGELKSYDATEVAPIGEFELNGIELPTGYTRLSAFLNGKFGTGSNGRSKLRDGRGRFERQWDHGAGIDPDAASRTNRGDGTTGDHIGTSQSDAIRNITGTLVNVSLGSGAYGAGAMYISSKNDGANGGDGSRAGNLEFAASQVVPTGSDNRPKNDNTLRTIRWC